MASTPAQQRFLAVGNVCTAEEAVRHSVQAALQTRGGQRVYASGVADVQKAAFRATFGRRLLGTDEYYRYPVNDPVHVAVIDRISEELSRQHATILQNGRLRIGIAQKGLNLYLKYMWCLDPARAVPPHCPVDGLMLCAAGISGSWTSMDSLATYRSWIDTLRIHAKSTGYSSLAEWELDEWARARP